MLENRKTALEYKTLNLKDLFIEVLIHWKGIIIAALIGGLILGGYSLYSSYKENRIQTEKKSAMDAAKQYSLDNTENSENELRLSELENALSDKSKNNVQAAITLSEQLESYEQYMTNSVFMLVDEKEIPKGTVSFCAVSDSYDPVDISSIYKGILSSSELLEYVKKQCNLGTEVSEQIIVDQANEKVPEREAAVNISVYALTEEQCKDIINAICDYADKKCSELQSSLGRHDLIVLDSSVSKVYEKERIEDKITLQNNVINLRDSIAKFIAGFTTEEGEYFNILHDKIHRDTGTESQFGSLAREEIIIPPVKVSKKKLLIGIAGGLFVYIFAICLIYILSHKIKDSDDFETIAQIPQLGKVYGFRNYKGLTKKIYSLKFAGRKILAQADAEAIVSDIAAAVAKKEGIDKLGVISLKGAPDLVESLSLSASKKSVDVVSISEVLFSREQMNKLDSVDAVLLIARPMVSKYDDVYEVVNLLDNRGIKILGGVMD